MPISFLDLRKELDEGVLRRFYIFEGEEHEMMKRYARKLGTVRFADSLSSVLPLLRGGGFMKPTVFYIREDVEAMKMSVGPLDKLTRTHRLVLAYQKLDGRTKFYAENKQFVVQFTELTDEQLVSYVQAETDYPDDACTELVQRCAPNLSSVMQAIQKLHSVPPPITVDRVREHISRTRAVKTFDLIDAISRRDVERVWEMWEQGIQEPISLVALLYTRFKQMFLVRYYAPGSDYDISKKTKVPVFIVKMILPYARMYTVDELLEGTLALQEAEVRLKSREREPDLFVQQVVQRLLAKKEPSRV